MFPIFVYGSLMRELSNHHYLARPGVRIVGPARLLGKWNMYTMNGRYPFIVPDDNGGDVVGELYEVDINTLGDLDRLEGVPHHYARIPGDVEVEHVGITAGVYVLADADAGRYADAVPGNNWRAFVERRDAGIGEDGFGHPANDDDARALREYERRCDRGQR